MSLEFLLILTCTYKVLCTVKLCIAILSITFIKRHLKNLKATLAAN